MVAFDNSIFCLALHPTATPPAGVDRAKERVQFLLDTLRDQNERILIPTPAFSEFLILAANDAPAYILKIRENSLFRVEPFDQRAAIELADIELTARAKGNKLGPVLASWQKVKFDRQIVAVAKVHHAVSQKFLQSYLDEYSFRYNRRDVPVPMFKLILEQVSEKAE